MNGKFEADGNRPNAVMAPGIPLCEVIKGEIVIHLDEYSISQKRISLSTEKARVLFNMYGRFIQLAEFLNGREITMELAQEFGRRISEPGALACVATKS